jgi:hypothetical protein
MPVEEGSPVIGSIDAPARQRRPLSGQFLPGSVEDWDAMWSALLWDAVAASFSRWRAAGHLAEAEARSDRWRLGHRRRGVDLQHLLGVGCGTASSSVASAVGAGHSPLGPLTFSGPTAASRDSGPAGPARWRQRRLAAGAGRTSQGIPEQFVLAIGVVKARGVSVALLVVVIWSSTCPRRSVRLPT